MHGLLMDETDRSKRKQEARSPAVAVAVKTEPGRPCGLRSKQLTAWPRSLRCVACGLWNNDYGQLGFAAVHGLTRPRAVSSPNRVRPRREDGPPRRCFDPGRSGFETTTASCARPGSGESVLVLLVGRRVGVDRSLEAG